MLLIQDIHIVIGREEIPFEEAYRTTFAPRVDDAEGTRFAGFLWAPHGAGEGYEGVTLTAVHDLEALARHQDRLATGDLATVWVDLEAKQRLIDSSLHLLADWSPMIAGIEAPASSDNPVTLFRLDTFTVPGAASEAVASVEAQFRSAGPDDLVAIVGCWSSFLGALATPVVSVLSRVISDEAFKEAVTDPTRPWPGTPGVQGARRQTRLLRSVSWSAVHR